MSIDPHTIQLHFQQFHQKPLHLAIVLDDNEALNSCCQLVNVVTWCVAAGIPNLTLYDHQGILKQNLVTLKRDLEARRDFFIGSKNSQFIFVDSPMQNVESNMNIANVVNGNTDGTMNGKGQYINPSHVRICVTSAEDGQETIIKILQKLAQQINEKGQILPGNETMDKTSLKMLLDANGNIQKNKIQEVIEKTLSQVDEQYWPAPDFILKFGNPIVWTGFLPWQMRYSEILFTGSLNGFDIGTFIKSMDKFNECGRRFGK